MAAVPPTVAVTSVSQCCILRCILGMLTDMRADFRYLPFVVLPPLQHEQLVQVQLLPHLQLPSPWPMEHNIKKDNWTRYCTIYGINVRCSYLFFFSFWVFQLICFRKHLSLTAYCTIPVLDVPTFSTSSSLPRPLSRESWTSSLSRIINHRHTTPVRTPLDECSARRRDLYLTIHSTHKKQTCMSPARFEPTKRVAADPHALGRAANWDRQKYCLTHSN
jgi:hypothetical protein